MTPPGTHAAIWSDRWTRIRACRADGVTELRMHRDDGPLVWDASIHQQLTDALLVAGEDRDTKVLILTGTGDSFCDAIDLPSFYRAEFDWSDIWLEGRQMLERLVNLGIPLVTAINGPARFHAELGMLGDVVLATPDAVLADRAHFIRGVTPGDGVHIVWPALLGPTRGRYHLLTGADVAARDALQMGVVHELHPREALRNRAWEIAGELAQMPRSTLQYTKMALALDLRRFFADDMSHGLALQGHGFGTRQEREGR